MTSSKAFCISLAFLFATHTLVSVVGYRLFTVRSQMPGDGQPIDITTPEQRAVGQSSFRVIANRRVTAIPVVFYICGGYAALGGAVLFLAFTRVRGG